LYAPRRPSSAAVLGGPRCHGADVGALGVTPPSPELPPCTIIAPPPPLLHGEPRRQATPPSSKRLGLLLSMSLCSGAQPRPPKTAPCRPPRGASMSSASPSPLHSSAPPLGPHCQPCAPFLGEPLGGDHPWSQSPVSRLWPRQVACHARAPSPS
jgi:hypothetical protein